MKRWFAVLYLLLWLSACGGQATPAGIATSTRVEVTPLAPAASPTTPVVPTSSAEPRFIPKSNDLIFIEFFAVT